MACWWRHRRWGKHIVARKRVPTASLAMALHSESRHVDACNEIVWVTGGGDEGSALDDHYDLRFQSWRQHRALQGAEPWPSCRPGSWPLKETSLVNAVCRSCADVTTQEGRRRRGGVEQKHRQSRIIDPLWRHHAKQNAPALIYGGRTPVACAS